MVMSIKTKEFRKKSSTSGSIKEMMSDIRKFGYLKKLKTMKKKYFVLRAETPTGPARLEYYDSEKKWKSGISPKRSIILKTCFNINRKVDSKQKHVIALYTRDDCFAIVTETDGELDQWLTAMLELQHGIVGDEGDITPKPNFEHVWQVTVKNKGLGSSRNISGTHRLCLTSKSLSLVKMNPHTDKQEVLEFPLMSIRRCGHSDCFFFMELGRSSVIGAGELWMQTEDTVIAQNMHEAILGAMKSSGNKEELGPLSRPRSASTSENSKPITSRHPISSVLPITMGTSVPLSSVSRERCDSMPSRSRTVSEGHQDVSNSPHTRGHYSSASCSVHLLDTPRPHTIYGRTMSYSPPSNNPLSPSGVCSSSSSLSFDELDSSLPDFHFSRFPHTLPGENTLQTEPTITEEGTDNEYLMMAPGEETSAESSLPTSKSNPSSLFLNFTTSPENDYLEMASPSSSTHPENTEGYMTMSAVGSLNVELSSSNISKSPSLVTEVPSNSIPAALPPGFDGYVPMAPIGTTVPTDLPLPSNISSNPVKSEEGYLDMTPLSSSLPKTISHLPSSQYLEMSSPTLSGNENLTQLLPSSSTEEFHLDKVKSYFSPSEDDSDDYIRPVRAYSIGSRPQLRKSHLSTHLETSRVRAYSVGSQAASSTKKNFSGIESELGVLKTIDARASVKSSSAPLLPSGLNQHRTSSSKGDYNEDLMEIDYNQPPSHAKVKVGSIQDNVDHTRRYPTGSGWQRSNSRSSSGTSPMSSLIELTEKIDRVSKTKNPSEENLPSKNISGLKNNDSEVINVQKNGNTSNILDVPHITSQNHVTEVKQSIQNSGNNNSSSNNETITNLVQASNPSGDYVNLDFNRTCTNTTAAGITGGKPITQNNAVQLDSISPLRSPAMHDYINIHLGGSSGKVQLTTSTTLSTVTTINSLPSKSDYTIMAPVQTSCEHSSSLPSINPQSCETPTTKSSQVLYSSSLTYGSSKNASLSTDASSDGQTPPPSTRSPQSFLTFRKQFSAPAAPISLRTDPPSPSRKSSCPVTSSFISIKPSVISPITITKPVSTSSQSTTTWLKDSHSPDHTCVAGVGSNSEENNSEQYNSNMLGLASSLINSQEKINEVTYENVSLGSGSVPNSRPSSISSERELNYASLDLAPSAIDDDKVPRSPRSFKVQQSSESYAEIDFTKSEGLRHTSGSLREGRI